MYKFTKIAAALGLLCISGSVLAQGFYSGASSSINDSRKLPTGLFTFDESGNSLGGLTSFTAPTDPTGGVAGPVLVYMLPASFGNVFSGDVRIYEPGSGSIDDLLRFTNAKGDFFDFANNTLFSDADRFIFYSDAALSPSADSGLPSNLPTTYFDLGGVNEVGPSGNNHFDYFFYSGVSDSPVPEPGTIALISSLGVGAVALIRKRRSR